MNNIKLTIAYDGTRFFGWQKQATTENTIQHIVESALQKALGKQCELTASGRTDAGVHALAQVANFHTESEMPPNEILRLANEALPGDIALKSAEYADPRFHSRYNCKSKTYEYRIYNGAVRDPFDRRYSFKVTEKLDTAAMSRSAKLFLGTHDFLGFSSLSKSKKSTERTVTEADVICDGDFVILNFSADGFLYNSVRIIVGTLAEIGCGKRGPESINKVFTSLKREDAGFTAPPDGLFLKSVSFRESVV